MLPSVKSSTWVCDSPRCSTTSLAMYRAKPGRCFSMHFTGYPQVISDVYFELRHIIYIYILIVYIYISINLERDVHRFIFLDVFSSIHSQQRSDPKIRQSLVEFLTSVTFVAIVQQMLQKPWLGFEWLRPLGAILHGQRLLITIAPPWWYIKFKNHEVLRADIQFGMEAIE